MSINLVSRLIHLGFQIIFNLGLEFNKLIFYQISGILADFLVSIFFIGIFKNVCAPVFGFALLLFSIFPLDIHLNILGTTLSVFFSSLILFFIRIQVLLKPIWLKKWFFYKQVLFPITIAFISMIPVILLKSLTLVDINLFLFIFIAGIYLISSFFAILNADRVLNLKMKQTIQKSINSLMWED